MKAKAYLRDLDANRRNKTEEAYFAMQKLRVRAGEILEVHWEPFKLRLGPKATYYTPDCLTIELDHTITIHEVKGFWQDDARVKFKVAAQMFPYFQFVAVTRKKGVWQYEFIPPIDGEGN